ncbi:hypothetical protein ACFV2H_05690 [Streptomyces sp. NPDC059629]|uniref:hypothetical protein n=1 Tax=Streptomyces sp. NPDC059629 TaxID=3346889 RepID=UPI003693ABBD
MPSSASAVQAPALPVVTSAVAQDAKNTLRMKLRRLASVPSGRYLLRALTGVDLGHAAPFVLGASLVDGHLTTSLVPPPEAELR